jgi:hypothetical protein
MDDNLRALQLLLGPVKAVCLLDGLQDLFHHWRAPVVGVLAPFGPLPLSAPV